MCVCKWCRDISEGPNRQKPSLESIILRVQWFRIEGFNLSPFLVMYFKGERAFLLPRWEYRAAGICISLAAVDIASKYGLNSGSGLARKDLHRDTVLHFSQSSEAAAAGGQRWPGEDTAGTLLHCPPEYHRSTSLCYYCPQRQGEMLDLQVAYWKFKVLTTALWFFFFF